MVNPALTELGLDSLTQVDGPLVIQRNPLLSQCDAEAFAVSVTATERTVDSNGPCTP